MNVDWDSSQGHGFVLQSVDRAPQVSVHKGNDWHSAALGNTPFVNVLGCWEAGSENQNLLCTEGFFSTVESVEHFSTYAALWSVDSGPHHLLLFSYMLFIIFWIKWYFYATFCMKYGY